MAIRLRLTGRTRFSSPLTYGTALIAQQIGNFSDEDGAALLTLMNVDQDPDVAVFTEVAGAGAYDYDFSGFRGGPNATYNLPPNLWTRRPPANSVPPGTEMTMLGVGVNGRSRWVSDGTEWRLVAPTILDFRGTQALGVGSTSLQKLYTSRGILRSVLASLYYYSVNFHLSKSGVANGATTITGYEGNEGVVTGADASVYSTTIFGATNRQAAGGHYRRFNPLTNRTYCTMPAQNVALEHGNASTGAFPTQQSGVLLDDKVFYSVGVTMDGTADIPALERFGIIGY